MDVIVVGCGASGVAALRRLHDSGLKVMGLEAADRIGGRINTVPFGANVVDIGAAWCHGEKSNVVFDLANPHGLLGRPNSDENYYILSEGTLASNTAVQELLKAINSSVENASKVGNTSISELIKRTAESSELLSNSSLTKSLVDWFEKSNHLGGQDDPQKGKSLRGLEENWPCDGEFMLNWKGRGYKTILDVLLNKYPDATKEVPIQMLLKKEVVSIRWGTTQNNDSDSSFIHVTCKDGSLYAAKSVIVTVSIGVLKESHSSLFNPSLPSTKIAAINNLELCVLDKIYVEFTKPWWPKSPAHFAILWKEEDKSKYSQYNWITEIHSVNTVEHQPNVLLFWLYGNGAKLMESASQEEVEAGVEKVLEIFKNCFETTPVKSILRSQWASNPLVRGAYSYRCVSTELSGFGAKELSEPLLHGEFPAVCFAGEATSHHRHNSVHGAIEAGFREADRLAKAFKT